MSKVIYVWHSRLFMSKHFINACPYQPGTVHVECLLHVHTVKVLVCTAALALCDSVGQGAVQGGGGFDEHMCG